MKSRDELLIELGAIYEAMRPFLPAPSDLPVLMGWPMVLFVRGKRATDLPWEDLDLAVQRAKEDLKFMQKTDKMMGEISRSIQKRLMELE